MMKTKSKVNKAKPVSPISLTPAQLKSRQPQLLVVDVRGMLEYWLGHIPGAQRLSRSQLLHLPKEQAIALTCLSGQRSAMTAQWLVAQGYQQIYNLQGGLMAWESVGYEVKRG